MYIETQERTTIIFCYTVFPTFYDLNKGFKRATKSPQLRFSSLIYVAMCKTNGKKDTSQLELINQEADIMLIYSNAFAVL